MKQGKTLPIDELVELYLKQSGLYRQFKEREACSLWNEVVGQMIASRTRKVSISNGVLFVSFTSSVVRNEIMMVKEGVIQALNARLGECIVKDIVMSCK